eukprot:TRINITY_DN21213_c0_g2_i2.p1 TRINITY_DN21213_c0_g2~~TRINITY_DN21213_c0_g2_i2.p1  ORF type:complete len:797 (+),score=377.30 TRINITY_DN21213_c0_g2_i2:118-2391(+)
MVATPQPPRCSAPRAPGRRSTLLDELKELQETHVRQVEDARKAEVGDLRREAEDLQRQLEAAQEEIRMKEFQCAGAAKEIDQLRCELARAQRECARAAEGCSPAVFEQKLYADVQTLEGALQSARGEIAHLSIKAQKAEEEAHAHQLRAAQLKGTLTCNEQFRQEEAESNRTRTADLIDKVNAYVSELQDALEAKDEAEGELRGLTQQLALARQQSAKAAEDRRRLLQAAAENKQFSDELQQVADQMGEELRAKEAEVMALREQLNQASCAAPAQQPAQGSQEQLQLVADLRNTLQVRSAELTQAVQEAGALRQDLAAATADLQASQERVRELEQRAAEENGRLAAKEGREHRLAGELAGMQEARDKALAELKQAQEELTARRAEEDREDTQQELSRATDEADRLRACVARAEEGAGRARRAAEEAKMEVAQLRQQLAASEAQTARMAGVQCGVDDAAAGRLAAEMQSRIAQAEQRAQQLDREKEEALTEVQRLLGEVADWKQRAESERQGAETQAACVERCRKKLAESEKNFQRAQEARRNLKRRANETIGALNTEVLRLEGLGNDYREQYEAVRQRLIRDREDAPRRSLAAVAVQRPAPVEHCVAHSPEPQPLPVAAECAPDGPSEEDLRGAVYDWLSARMQAEGTTDIPVSMKALRAELQEQLGCDLSQRRSELKDICNELLCRMQQQGAEPAIEQSQRTEQPSQQRGGGEGLSREDVAHMSFRELQALAKQMRLRATGKAADIRERLYAHCTH